MELASGLEQLSEAASTNERLTGEDEGSHLYRYLDQHRATVVNLGYGDGPLIGRAAGALALGLRMLTTLASCRELQVASFDKVRRCTLSLAQSIHLGYPFLQHPIMALIFDDVNTQTRRSQARLQQAYPFASHTTRPRLLKPNQQLIPSS